MSVWLFINMASEAVAPIDGVIHGALPICEEP
jgi:hypothetical protein